MIAWRGVSTFVETTVAIEFAVSWKPLMNSKASATRMTTRMSVMSATSGVLVSDQFRHAADVAAAVENLLQQVVEIGNDDHEQRVVIAAVEVLQAVEHQLV